MVDINNFLTEAGTEMEHAYNHAETMLKRVRANKVDEDMLHGITIDYYGVPSPIHQLATIKVDSLTTLRVKPWEKNLLSAIEIAICQHNHFGFTTRNDKDEVYVTLPIITEEVRNKLVKQVEHQAEIGKVAIRNIRKKTKENLKQIKSEDEMKNQEVELQKMTDKYIDLIDQLQEKKKQELMKV